jgi:hypothetical protein
MRREMDRAYYIGAPVPPSSWADRICVRHTPFWDRTRSKGSLTARWSTSMYDTEKILAEDLVGPRRVVALYYHSFTLYHIH